MDETLRHGWRPHSRTPMDPILGVKILEHYRGLEDPHYRHDGDSGFDLRAAGAAIVPPGAVAKVPTGLAFSIPEGYELQVRPRSGLASLGLTVANTPGTVDRGYTGEVQVLLVNHGYASVTIIRGDRIAQAVLAPVARAQLVFIEGLPETSRGDSGFGSSGVT